MTSLKDSLKFNTMEELKDIAREFDIRGFSTLRKEELIDYLVREMQTEDFIEKTQKRLNKSMLILLNIILTNQEIKYEDLKETFIKFRSIGTFYKAFNWLSSMSLIEEDYPEVPDNLIILEDFEKGEKIEDYFEPGAEFVSIETYEEYHELYGSRVGIPNELVWVKEYVSKKLPDLESVIKKRTDKKEKKEEQKVQKGELVKELSLKEQLIKKLENVSLRSSRTRNLEGIIIAIFSKIDGYKNVVVDETKSRTKINRPTLIAKRSDEEIGISIWHFPNASKNRLLRLKGSLYDFKKEFGENLIFYIYDMPGNSITNKVRKELEEDTTIIYKTKHSFE